MRLILATTLTLILCACGAERDPDSLSATERQAALSAAATTETVANDPALRAVLPAHAAILLDQARKVWAALQATAEEMAAAAVPFESGTLSADPDKAAAASRADADSRTAQIKQEREDAGFWGWVAGAGTLIGTVLLPRVLSAMGIPGGQLLARGIEWASGDHTQKKAQAIEKKLGTAVTTIHSSDLGRHALKKLDRAIGRGDYKNVSDAISALTDGEAVSIEGLFKHVAKANSDDKKSSLEVASLLSEIRDTAETAGGIPVELSKILKKLA